MPAPRGSANNGRCQGAKQRFMQQQPSQDIASADMRIDNYAAGVFRCAQNTDRCSPLHPQSYQPSRCLFWRRAFWRNNHLALKVPSGGFLIACGSRFVWDSRYQINTAAVYTPYFLPPDSGPILSASGAPRLFLKEGDSSCSGSVWMALT